MLRPNQSTVAVCAVLHNGPSLRTARGGVGAAKLSNGAAKHLRRVFQHLDDPEESIDVVAREFHVPTLEYLAPMLVFARLERARPLASCKNGHLRISLGIMTLAAQPLPHKLGHSQPGTVDRESGRLAELALRLVRRLKKETAENHLRTKLGQRMGPLSLLLAS